MFLLVPFLPVDTFLWNRPDFAPFCTDIATIWCYQQFKILQQLRQKRPWCFYLMRSSCPLNFVSYNSLQLTQLSFALVRDGERACYTLHAAMSHIFINTTWFQWKTAKIHITQKFIQLWHILYPVFLDPPSTVWRRDVRVTIGHDTTPWWGHLLLVLTLLYVTVSLQQ